MSPRISMVVTTVPGREEAIVACLASVDAQHYRDFELVLVDQGSSAVVRDAAARFAWCRYVPASPMGLSAARNRGLLDARGSLVSFPDDDCTLEPDFLERAVAHFDADPGLGLVTGRALEPTGGRALNRFPERSAQLTAWSLLDRHISITIVAARGAMAADEAAFDPRLGAGAATAFGGSEETDFCYRLVLRGHRGLYDPMLIARHANVALVDVPVTKLEAYGRGWGACFRKLSATFGWPVPALFAWSLVRPALGALIAAATGRGALARARWTVLAARIAGWRAFGRELRGGADPLPRLTRDAGPETP